MPFVVKATGNGFSANWLTPNPSDGSYTFGSRKDAINFPTLAEAQEAADKATAAYGSLGMAFTVEAA